MSGMSTGIAAAPQKVETTSGAPELSHVFRCRRGYVSLNKDKTASECSNPACESPPRVCPKCREGIMVLRLVSPDSGAAAGAT